MNEFCHNIEPFMQPHPVKNPGGDCYACALTAAVQFLYPDNPIPFDEAWEYFRAPYANSTEMGTNNTWPGMEKALYKASHAGRRLEITSDIVKPTLNPRQWSHAWWQFVPVADYTRLLEAYFRAGWVAFTEINFAGVGPYSPDGKLHTIDHYVLLDGVKWEWEGSPSGGGFYREYVHVVCSVKGAYWIQTHDLLVKRGAAAWWLARRDDR